MFYNLLLKDLTLELRRKSVISGLVLYLVSISFICYITFSLKQNQITPLVWSALFWITMLFTAVNTVAKSFIGEKKGSEIYLYSIAHPETIILSKITYNFFVTLALSFVCLLLFVLFLKNPIEDYSLFSVLLVLMSLAFSATLSLLSALSAKANNSNILMAVLSFPVIISALLIASR
jgi:ABC-type transport system involved in cytochrome c biogenesis, permease component